MKKAGGQIKQGSLIAAEQVSKGTKYAAKQVVIGSKVAAAKVKEKTDEIAVKNLLYISLEQPESTIIYNKYKK